MRFAKLAGSLFVALGSRIISFANLTMFLADKKEDYIKQQMIRPFPPYVSYDQKVKCWN